MLLNKKSIELLAPVGKWDTLQAAVNAGADAVYLGGKAFNMRMFRNDFNFDNNTLKKAVKYVHSHDVKVYLTLNNLISEEEIPALTEYLKLLNDDIRPDALIVQDFAVIELIRELGLDLNLHSSIMMNTHNSLMIDKFKQYGISRVVASREMSLNEIRLLKEKSAIELEYFIHGDMCIAEGGQCFHSGVVFGNSSNRGRCMKPCRWQYKFAEEKDIDNNDKMVAKKFSYKLALKDMCMYRALPQLIQSGVYSFKIEGRMRDAEFISQIVGIYRRAIDKYIHDPAGYSINQNDWHNLEIKKVRGYSTCFALGKPTYADIGLSGKHEPRFFSNAIKESAFTTKAVFPQTVNNNIPLLAVRCATLDHVKEACAGKADIIYAGGDVYRPLTPWTIEDIKKARELTQKANCQLVISTPRITKTRELKEMEQLFASLTDINPDGILVHNMGTLALAQTTNLPVRCGVSFSIFNSKAASLLQKEGAVMGTASLELSYAQVNSLLENSPLPIEIIVHGAIEAMICDFDFIAEETGKNQLTAPEAFNKHYAFIDTASEIHSIRRTQYDRNYILFAHDLCLLPYIDKLNNAASFCIEAQDYTPEYTGRLVHIYRRAIDNLTKYNKKDLLKEIEINAPRKIGNGVYRYDSTK
ncbi:peptidase U32 family protein [Pectinatus sottacetonis]|uniref:peptidase U32 family protein n=1 Tax=Pectinatus sottacetonis TaxID=1002795 RepID=UPI0018C83753|nr:U32 family peptidase [Pectinatus sottacetonis]